MRYVSLIVSLVLGLALGCMLVSLWGDPGTRAPGVALSHLDRASQSEQRLVPGEKKILAAVSSREIFAPSEFGESEMARRHAAVLNISRLCTEVSPADLPGLFEKLGAMEGEEADEASLGLSILAARWAKIDPEAASAAAAELIKKKRAMVEHAIWQVWARRDLSSFRAHMEGLRQELESRLPLGIPFRDPLPWFKADPLPAMEALLDQDWYNFRENHSFLDGGATTAPDDAKPLPLPHLEDSRQWVGMPEAPPVLKQWLARDEGAALAWTRDVVSRENIPPRQRFHMIHFLNEFGYHDEAAELAANHLTEDLRRIALERMAAVTDDSSTGR